MLQNSSLVARQILKESGLSCTRIRENLIAVLLESKVALSSNEIHRRMSVTCDRVTLYRNLRELVRRGIAHQVVINSHESRYALPDRTMLANHQYSEHIHFKCLHCNKVQCLEENLGGAYHLPQGFVKTETNFVVFGLCNICNQTPDNFE